MTQLILKDQAVWFGELDLQKSINAVALDYSAEAQDDSTLGFDTRSNLAGLKVVTAGVEGFWQVQPDDQALFGKIGLIDEPMSFGAAGAAEGDHAFTFLSMLGKYQAGESIGNILGMSCEAQGRGQPLVGGTLMHNAARTATANGTARQLGAVSATQKLYAALHVSAASGTSPQLDVKVQSDTAVGFPSPADRITFAAKVAAGAEWAAPVVGPITDDYWRVVWTIAGTSPSFTFAVVVGIQ